MNPVATQFWTAALFFHLIVGAAAFWLGRRWVVRAQKVRLTWVWLLQLLADSVLLGFCALIAALCMTVFSPSMFTTARLISQAVFLEGTLLAVAVACIHYRAGQRKRAWLPGAIAVLLVACYVEAYHREPHNLQVRTHNLGSGAETLRILHLSDLQTHEIGPYERRVFAVAKKLAPDLVVFTGDYIQPLMGSDPVPAMEDFRRLLASTNLNPKHGFYVVGGDVERGLDWKVLFRDLPVETLDDSFTQTDLPGGKKLTIIGLSNPSSRGTEPSPIDGLLQKAPRGDVRLFIGHSPDFVRRFRSGHGVDLALAGHTHGGQVVIPPFGPLMTLSRLPHSIAAGGMHRYKDANIHISRGIGMERRTAPQLRFFCPPEICLIELRY
jgi:uncharacterized protein